MKVLEFISKLQKIEFSKVEDKTLTGTLNGKDVEVIYRLKLSDNMIDIEKMPVQMLIQVRVEGTHALTYGAASNKDNSALVEFFVKAEVRAQQQEFKEDKLKRQTADEVFNFFYGE